jgi:hypothetical protein
MTVKPAKCPRCKNEEAKMNRARTIFCPNCKLHFSRILDNPTRSAVHPNYEKYGCRIKTEHSDFLEIMTAPGTTLV